MHLPDQYRALKNLYSTYFGKYIPIEVDVCVICNLLYLLFEDGTELTNFDSDSIKFICSVINYNEHLQRPFRIAPFYPKAPVIIYHVARLLTITSNPDLLKLKEKLILDSQHLLKSSIHPMERVILNTAIMWLSGEKSAEDLQTPTDIEFPWFIAGMISSAGRWDPLIYWFCPKLRLHLQFYCEVLYKETSFF